MTVRGIEGVLFDVDGTLLVGSSDHLTALVAVLSDRLGRPVAMTMRGERPVIDGVDVAGYIDAQVVRALLPPALDPAGLAQIMSDYAARFEAGLGAGTFSPGRIVAGARAALDELARSGVELGVSTGNASLVARAKLAAHGLAGDDDSSFPAALFTPAGGFGDIATDRRGVARAAARSLAVPPAAILLVGDTASDMDAASANGLTGVGVLTGAASASELRAAGATHVVPSVADVPGLVGRLPR